MDNPANAELNLQKKKTNVKHIVKLGCGGILILSLICVFLYFLLVVGIGGEPANAFTVEKVTQQFVAALHDGEIEEAHKMLSDFSIQEISIKTLSDYSEEEPISKYKDLQVCEFKIFYENTEKILVGMGIIFYENSSVKFQVDMLQDGDKNWKIREFILGYESDPEPWAGCG